MAQRFIAFLIWAYTAAVVAVWLTLHLLADRFWPATLMAFGPRWPYGLPLLILIPVSLLPSRRIRHLGLLTATALLVLLGVMDFRLGIGRSSQARSLRLMTHNVGFSHITPQLLNAFLTAEHVDIATLQECPLAAEALEPLGWHAFSRYNECLLSRFPVDVVDVRDPMDIWKLGGSGDIARYEIQTPAGRLKLQSVHLETIRDGLEAILVHKFAGVPEFTANRNECALESRLAREWSQRGRGDLIVTGDFNLPVESAIFKNSWGDLRNAFSSCGRGLGYTKMTSWFGIRIDHVLLGDGWTCNDARVLASPYGGDHRPMIVDLAH